MTLNLMAEQAILLRGEQWEALSGLPNAELVCKALSAYLSSFDHARNWIRRKAIRWDYKNCMKDNVTEARQS